MGRFAKLDATMLNRLLCLFLAVVAPVGALAVWVTGAQHAPVSIAWAERMPALALVGMSLVLALCHVLAVARGSLPLRAVAWLGLASYFLACATTAPHIGAWLGLAALTMALASVAMLVGERMQKRLVRVERRRSGPAFA